MEASGAQEYPAASPRPDRTHHTIKERDASAYIAEFLGTFMLVLFITSILSVGPGLGFNDFAVIGLVHVLVLSMLVYSLGGTSGAHFNPAVTLALTALRKIRPNDAAIYVLLQIAGAVAGALVTKLLLLDEGRGAKYGATVISESFLQGKPLPALLAEFLGTFALMWAFMAMAVNPRGERNFAGIVIGGTLGFAVMTFGPLTGGSFNPARTLGPALVAGEWADFWVYIVAPVLGAVAAATAYTAIVLNPQDKIGQRPIDKLA